MSEDDFFGRDDTGYDYRLDTEAGRERAALEYRAAQKDKDGAPTMAAQVAILRMWGR